MLTQDKITEIYFIIDEFFKDYSETISRHSLVKDASKKRGNRSFKLSDSEVMTILVLFHYGYFKTLKDFYIGYVQKHMTEEFPHTVSYNRFVELQQKVIIPLGIFMKINCLGKCTGISFIDSTSLRVSHIRREKQHKTFKNIAMKGQFSLGWFFGFKLHLIINDQGELLDFMLTKGNVDDHNPLKNKNFHKNIFGKLFGDKGYLGKDLFEQLFIDGVHLVTKIKKNMKNNLMLMSNKIMLKKRALIETVNDELKNICQVKHTVHRCFNNFITNVLSALIAYSFFPKKPSINTKSDFIDENRLIA